MDDMNATLLFDELQVTVEVRLFVVPSENVPVAVNCSRKPVLTVGLLGVTSMETSATGVTVSVARFEVLPEKVADIFVVPVAMVVASPLGPDVLSNVATAEAEETHVAEAVRSCVELSE